MATNGSRAAVYTRVSTLDQGAGASLTTQKADCRGYCDAHGLTVVAEFQDLPSGLSVDRQQYQDMLRQAESGGFDVVVCWKMDRFGRDRIEAGFQIRELQKIGVRVDSATEPNDSPLLRNILLDFAEEESRRISVRVSANKRTLAQRGRRSSQPPFGYSNAPHPEGGITLVPNEDAPVVAYAFELYASGRATLASVRDYISAHSVSPKHSTTRAAAGYMLRNPIYTGGLRYGYWSNSKIQVKPKEERRAEAFLVKEAHPAIVDEDTWHRAQERLQQNRPIGSGRLKAAYLFTGLVWCGCGYRRAPKKVSKHSISYYCQGKMQHGGRHCPGVSEKRIRAAVLTPIEQLLAGINQEDVRARVRQRLSEEEAAQRAATRGAKQGITERLGRLEKRMTTWLEMVGDGEMTREQYAQLRAEYEPQIEELRSQLAQRPHLALPDLDRFLAVADALAGESPDEPEWRGIIEGTVHRITIEGRDIRATWQEWFKPLRDLA